MFGFFRLIKNLALMHSRLKQERARQVAKNYRIETTGDGPETYITYFENGKEIAVWADFTVFNDVTLYTYSLKRWHVPRGNEVTASDYQKVLDRVIQYLSCWGKVTLDDSRNP